MNIRIKPLALLVAVCGIWSRSAAEDPMAIVQRAYQLQQQGNYVAAAEAYHAFLKLQPNEVGAHSNLGVVLTKLGRFDEAIQEYEAAEKLLPGDARIGVNLALAYEKSGRMQEAAKRLEALHQSLPQEKQITILLADAHLQAGENDHVVSLLRPLEEQTPDDPAIAYLLGTALIRRRDLNEGQVLLDRILKNGDSAEARFLLGMQMFESGDFPSAVKQFAAASEANANLPELQAYFGQALLITGDADGASLAFQRELQQNTFNFAANLGLGQILTARKAFTEAEPLLKKAARVRPQSAEAQVELGRCLAGESKFAEARPILEAAVKVTPQSWEAHRELANVYAGLRLPQASRERATSDALRQASEAKSSRPGPKSGELAPDFTLPNVTTERAVSLRDFQGKSPVVLIFGSYSCPNFRSSATALKALQAKYGAQTPFLLIYIREAHAKGDWQSTRNERDGIDLAPATVISEKQDHAMMCSRALHLPFPALLDGMDDKVETAYGAWPSRAFVIDREGRVRYSSRLTELDFSADEMESALQTVIGKSGRN